MNSAEILMLLRDIAEAEGGDVSLRRFLTLSGLKEKQVVGAHWPTWNAAKSEAGLGTVAFVRPRINEERALPAFAELISHLGKWPTQSELRLARKRDEAIPSVQVSWRLLRDHDFLKRLRAFSETKPQLAVVAKLATARSHDSIGVETTRTPITGHVYMMKSGRRYKIGHTTSPTRRHREVRLDLPEPTDLVHSIETDDPKGIETYWHVRFKEKRVRDTEFFELTAGDVAAFKKRRFQ
jgi:hypothetical protein